MNPQVKRILKPIARPFKEYYDKVMFKRRLRSHSEDDLRIVVGSSGIFQKGWIPTEAHTLNLLDESTWAKYFNENRIHCLLAEHVWEHLTLEEGKEAARICYKYLEKNGRLRVAVPDGFHSSQAYINYVKPGGYGAGADDHKVLYNFKTFSSLFEEIGFKVRLLEYFDEDHEFHANDWDHNEGFIHRSLKHDKRNSSGEPVYTSLILDAIKT